MKKDLANYLQNTKEARERSRPVFGGGLSCEELLVEIRKNTARLREIMLENDAILAAEVFKYTEKPERMTAEIVADLCEFSDQLMRYERQIDNSVHYVINSMLLKYGKFHNDVDTIVRALYEMGLSMFYLNAVPKSLDIPFYEGQIRSCFSEAAQYVTELDNIENWKTREYVIRSLGNIRLSHSISSLAAGNSKVLYSRPKIDLRYSISSFNRTLAVLQDEKYRRQTPEIDWDSLTYAMHYARTVFMSVLRSKEYQSQSNTELTEMVMESAQYVYDNSTSYEREDGRVLNSRTLYIYNAALFHSGRITIDELLTTFCERLDTVAIDDYTSEGIYANLYLGVYCNNYWQNFAEGETVEKWREKMDEVFNRSCEYLLRIPATDFFTIALNYIRSSSVYMLERSVDLQDYFLTNLLSFHRPIHAHSLMTAEIAGLLCRELIESNPELLSGVLGIVSREEITARAEEIIDTCRNFGRYHDVGKVMAAEVVCTYNRTLINEEKDIIKCHAYGGYLFLSACGENAICAQAALGHHRWYDGSDGYPDVYKREDYSERVLTDIIAVADSIDAATNDVDRSYARPKSLDDIIDELVKMSGTRYSPFVAALLKDPKVYEKLSDLLVTKRREIYAKVYAPDEGWRMTE